MGKHATYGEKERNRLEREEKNRGEYEETWRGKGENKEGKM